MAGSRSIYAPVKGNGWKSRWTNALLNWIMEHMVMRWGISYADAAETCEEAAAFFRAAIRRADRGGK